jgi:hypothetical protein
MKRVGMDPDPEGDMFNEKNENDWALLARSFAGEASAAERSEIERWAASEPGRCSHGRYLQQLRAR